MQRLIITFVMVASMACGQSSYSRGGLDQGEFDDSLGTGVVISDTGVVESTGSSLQGQAMPYPGCLFLLDGTGAIALIGGHDGTHGVLQRWHVPDVGSPPQLLDSYSSLGSDFTGVTYDDRDQSLFLLDSGFNLIWHAYWTPGTPLPTTWSIWADEVDSDFLTESGDMQIYYSPVAPGPVPHIYIGVEGSATMLSYTQGQILAGTGPGSIVVTPYTLAEGSPTDSIPHILADETTASEGGTTVYVYGNAGETVEVVEAASGTPIGSAVVPAGDEGVTVNLTQPLEIGKSYVAHKVGEPVNNEFAFVCSRRYGWPETAPDGSAMCRLYTPLDAEIGNQNFAIYCRVTNPNPPAMPLRGTISLDGIGFMGLGLRDGNGQDPVLWTGTNWMVDPASVLFFPVSGVMDSRGNGFVSVETPIPNDPALVGMVAIYQFGLTDSGSNVYLSEVLGVEIKAP